MSTANEPAPIEQLRFGPVRVVEVITSPPPTGRTVVDSIGNEQVPFEKIRHLCSHKPLTGPARPESTR